jgi:transketolase
MLDSFYQGGRGHLPSALSCADIVSVLYDSTLRFRPDEPEWAERDRFILSKGHGCLAQYVLLADKGFFPEKELERFCSFGAPLGGHPERNLIPGVEASTGSLGHGPSLGIGMALAARLDGRPSRVFVLCGDGETDEGSVWEACLCAAKYGLDNFSLIIDCNKLQAWDAVANILPLEPYADKFRAFGFAVTEVDGHATEILEKTFSALPLSPGKPTCVICHTVKGKGIASLENNLAWHHRTNLSEEEYRSLLGELLGRGEVAQ